MGTLTTLDLRLSGEPLGIALRIGSTLAFAAMTACIKALGDTVPLGQVVFFRSAVALLPLSHGLCIKSTASAGCTCTDSS